MRDEQVKQGYQHVSSPHIDQKIYMRHQVIMKNMANLSFSQFKFHQIMMNIYLNQ